MAPALLLFAFVVLVPSARGVYYAFTDWDGLDPHFSFVGLGNFADMLRDGDAMQAVWHTLTGRSTACSGRSDSTAGGRTGWAARTWRSGRWSE
jgi:ABC-type polysaccharide transport system permease subunit